jgi:hypothetical protein
MHTQRTHVILPQDLLTEIDGLVGPRGRSAFLVETVRAELQRRKLLQFLRSDEPIWRDEDHPELARGSEAWIRSLRSEGRGAKTGKLKSARKRTK